MLSKIKPFLLGYVRSRCVFEPFKITVKPGHCSFKDAKQNLKGSEQRDARRNTQADMHDKLSKEKERKKKSKTGGSRMPKNHSSLDEELKLNNKVT